MNENIELKNKILNLVDKYSKIKFLNPEFIPGETVIPVSGKVIDAEELKNMVEASLDGWLTTGRFNKAFEEKLSGYLNVKYLITTNSGSSANLIAFNVLTSLLLGDRAIK